MTHLLELIGRFDYDTGRLLAAQLLTPGDPRYGAFVGAHHVDSRNCGFYMAQVLTAYICRESRYYLSSQVKEALEACFVFMKNNLRPSGCVDLTGCNFDSAPDTAFTANELIGAWWLMEKRMCPELEWLVSPLRALLITMSEGIAAGVSFGSGDTSAALLIAGGIALQNIPEGMVIIAPMLAAGIKPGKTFFIALLTGLVEVAGTLIGYFAVSVAAVILPFALAFAGGTMLYVVSDEMIPETHHSNTRGVTWALLIGFCVILLSDVLLG